MYNVADEGSLGRRLEPQRMYQTPKHAHAHIKVILKGYMSVCQSVCNY